jgi:hypothetical protein
MTFPSFVRERHAFLDKHSKKCSMSTYISTFGLELGYLSDSVIVLKVVDRGLYSRPWRQTQNI